MSLAQMCLAFALIGGLTPLADAFLRRYRCPDRCNPHPDRPVNRCLYFCLNLIPYGHYYDGTECYHLSPLGNLFDWRGYCYRGFCTRWRSHPSAAEIYCGNGTTSTSTTVRTTKRESSAVTVPDTSPSTVVSSTLNTVSDIGASSKVQTTPPTTPEMTSASDKPTEAVTDSTASNKTETTSQATTQSTALSEKVPPPVVSNATSNEVASSNTSQTTTTVAETEPTNTEKPAQNYTVTTTTAAAQPVTVTDKGNATSLDENEAIRGTEVKLTDVAPS
ncbi:uncharacterized protein LOC119464843 isoform X3 [Dermacentor silvarum]|uniref:uncharacterized protein LOC119464843 isoform X3 n=1 Tax=Dermacentor silvarum TaxID=543639 RepID=UPI0021014595|nr:uncharacterized protein LOC119464843 isoform X3 [Dermacentor silvarum]